MIHDGRCVKRRCSEVTRKCRSCGYGRDFFNDTCRTTIYLSRVETCSRQPRTSQLTPSTQGAHHVDNKRAHIEFLRHYRRRIFQGHVSRLQICGVTCSYPLATFPHSVCRQSSRSLAGWELWRSSPHHASRLDAASFISRCVVTTCFSLASPVFLQFVLSIVCC